MTFWQILIGIVLLLMALFMILLVLIQRGKGGGLVGALGGMGGQSAFGTKAGDLFTKITMWTAFLWIVLCAVAVRSFATSNNPLEDGRGGNTAPQSPGESGSGQGTQQNP
jgi:preprotein translocase subunit SecG